MVDKFTRYSCIPGMLVFGTATVTIQKFIFDVEGWGRPGTDIHKFKKPWFQTESMFMGMLSCLIVYEIIRLTRACKAKKQTDAEAQLNPAEDDSIQHWKHYFYVAAPAICDLVATSLMNIGLFYLDASIWQMLRGSMVIFSAILTIIFLKRKYYSYHWFGITLVTIGLVTVAGASLMRNDGDKKTAETWQIVMAICLVVGAQIVQASQIVIEEYLLKNVKAAASLIVGLEGLWGGLIGALIIWAVHNTNPESSALVKEVFHEDTIDTFYMIYQSSLLIWLVIFYILCILFYNLFGMMVTQTYSAVYRTIMEAVRTLCIWIVNVIIHFFLPKFGEPLDGATIVELIGFAILLTGNFTFNKVLRFKCFYYEDKQ